MSAHPKTPLSSSRSLQMTPQSSASFKMVTSQNSGDDHGLQDKPPCSPPTHHHEQHCDCSGVIQVPGHHNLSGPEVGHSHWLHYLTAEAVLPPPAEEVQPATGAAETVLLWHQLRSARIIFNITRLDLSERKSYTPRMPQRRVKRKLIFIFGWTNPLITHPYVVPILYDLRSSSRRKLSIITHAIPAGAVLNNF